MSIGSVENICFCDFCGKNQHQVETMIAGPTVHICDECVECSMAIILNARHPDAAGHVSRKEDA